jgi:glucosamine-phosphate N-acetyltransferase
MVPEIKIKIRKAILNDFEQIYQLLPQLWPHTRLNRNRLRITFSRALNSGQQYYLCAFEKKVIVGFCSLSTRNSLWQQGLLAHIDELIVDQSYRGRGIGTRLMTEAIKLAVKKRCSRIELDSAFHRKHAHGFYNKMGFESRAYLFSKVAQSTHVAKNGRQ